MCKASKTDYIYGILEHSMHILCREIISHHDKLNICSLKHKIALVYQVGV